MFGAVRRERTEACISDLRFDAWFARELDAGAKAELLQHVSGCRRCRGRLDGLLRSRERFVAAEGGGLPAWLKAQPERTTTSGPRRGWVLYSLLGAAACALLAIGLGEPEQPKGERAKGGEYVSFFVKRGADVRRGSLERPLQPGDHLRFTYTTDSPRYLAILSVDRASIATIYYPAGERAARVEPGSDVPLPAAVKLDDSLGFERIVALFCDSPQPLAQLKAAVVSEPSAPRVPGCAADSLSVMKEAVTP